ncbi:hypothetical protein E1B28_008988 [Marasmius oreades]|uniref:F-box domain-containing protein n=1 Tax=Marasmius oreades TaxID=181124 RepID=A0A9P7RZI0_9AGAR|nr:uncharacterized protein E1B28_008988 [Marasmius oreades]KAG7092651.1 hypothetical protein E1B28_008988 [Marasmius oreades]
MNDLYHQTIEELANKVLRLQMEDSPSRRRTYSSSSALAVTEAPTRGAATISSSDIHVECVLGLPVAHTSPFQKLPQELLVDVFAQACEGAWLLMDVARVPTLFSLLMVCVHWHKVILSTPSLWSTIRVKMTSRMKRTEDLSRALSRLTKLVRLYLHRSGSSPLTMVLHLHIPFVTERDGFLGVLAQSANRWKSVALLSVKYPPLQHILPHSSFLENLQIKDYSVGDSSLDLSGCGSLISFGCFGPLSPTRIILPWKQLKKLDLDIGTDHRDYNPFLVPVLDLCPQLDTLSLFISYTGYPLGDPIVHSRIQRLQLRSVRSASDFFSIFRRFSFPSLSTLIIGGHSYAWNINIEPFRDFLVRSSCIITHLDLGPRPASDEKVLSLLQLLPSLVSLRIEEWRPPPYIHINHQALLNEIITPKFLSALSFTDPPLIPRLRDVTFALHGRSLNEEALVTSITSRSPGKATELGVECLRSLTVEILDKVPLSSKSSFQQIRDVGIYVNTFQDAE